MSKRGTVIWCEKKQDRMPLILSGCGIADPRTKYVNGRFAGGDRSRDVSEAEKAWMHVWYPVLEWSELQRVLLRPRVNIISIANRFGIARGDCVERRKKSAAVTQSKLRERGLRFNAAQCAYIEQCFAADYWPKKHFGREPYKTKADAVRAEIVARVAALDKYGRVWPWESIRSHMKWVSPSYRRDTSSINRKRRAQRREWDRRRKDVAA